MGLGVHKNDLVVVLAGKDRGRQGTIMRVSSKDHTVLVEGVNIVTRHLGQSRGVRVKAVIVRTMYPHRRIDGSYIRFDDNAAVIIETNVRTRADESPVSHRYAAAKRCEPNQAGTTDDCPDQHGHS